MSLADGRVLLMGGFVTIGGFNRTIINSELYDPASQSWAATGDLFRPRHGHTATLLSIGEVLVVGGAQVDSIPTAELFNPTTGIWTRTNGPFFNRTGHTASLLHDGTVLVVG